MAYHGAHGNWGRKRLGGGSPNTNISSASAVKDGEAQGPKTFGQCLAEEYESVVESIKAKMAGSDDSLFAKQVVRGFLSAKANEFKGQNAPDFVRAIASPEAHDAVLPSNTKKTIGSLAKQRYIQAMRDDLTPVIQAECDDTKHVWQDVFRHATSNYLTDEIITDTWDEALKGFRASAKSQGPTP